MTDNKESSILAEASSMLNDDDDDDLANLFSFDAAESEPREDTSSSNRDRSESNDSFLKMLDSAGTGVLSSAPKESVTPETPVVEEKPPAPVYATLDQALEGGASPDVLQELAGECPTISNRPLLYCRLLVGKSVEETAASSLADAYEQFVCIESTAAAAKLVAHHANPHVPHTYLQPIVETLLTTGLAPPVASVVLYKLLSSQMPLWQLPEGAGSLHDDFLRLASYHVPLLVYHLDRYVPGWHGLQQEDEKDTSNNPRGKHPGQLPPSWFLTLWAGPLAIWDWLLLSTSHDMRFFLALALLQDFSQDLLLLTDAALLTKLQELIAGSKKADDLRKRPGEWWKQARFLQSCTPESVIRMLHVSPDQAMRAALEKRQEQRNQELQQRLEAQAAAHERAQEEQAEQARQRLTRARLVAFYRIHAPEKEDKIDEIMEKYADQMPQLDAKLKFKYGEGFHPALKPVEKQKGPGVFASLRRRKTVEETPVATKDDEPDLSVSVSVASSEVIPAICWSKEASLARIQNRRQRKKALKFYVVDSRSPEAAAEQGRFPTAVTLSPEALLDPEQINEEMFESLRGAVHIVVMGEGFASLPTLYNHKVSANLERLMQEDESRTNNCALYFIKKGFPFVSILQGGFAAAHSWLVRQGPEHHLNVSKVLVDYSPKTSLFGQMEEFHSSSTSERASRIVQNLLDSSLVAMTKRAQQLEKLTMEREQKENKRYSMPRFGFKQQDFRNPFANKQQTAKPQPPKPGATTTEASKTAAPAEEAPKTTKAVATPTAPAPQEKKTFSNPFAQSKPLFQGFRKKDESNATTNTTPAVSNPFKGFKVPGAATFRAPKMNLGGFRRRKEETIEESVSFDSDDKPSVQQV